MSSFLVTSRTKFNVTDCTLAATFMPRPSRSTFMPRNVGTFKPGIRHPHCLDLSEVHWGCICEKNCGGQLFVAGVRIPKANTPKVLCLT
jgi:hypothetical protein